jgi:hypothetical protein
MKRLRRLSAVLSILVPLAVFTGQASAHASGIWGCWIRTTTGNGNVFQNTHNSAEDEHSTEQYASQQGCAHVIPAGQTMTVSSGTYYVNGTTCVAFDGRFENTVVLNNSNTDPGDNRIVIGLPMWYCFNAHYSPSKTGLTYKGSQYWTP